MRGNDFIAHWAYAERIFAYAQPAFKFRQFLHGHLNACWTYAEYDFQKSRVTGSWDIQVSVSAKKSKNKIHACVPLKLLRWRGEYLFVFKFFLHYSSRHTIFIYTTRRVPSCCPHGFRSVEGLLWGSKPKFELGPAVQQADALLSEPPPHLSCILLSNIRANFVLVSPLALLSFW